MAAHLEQQQAAQGQQQQQQARRRRSPGLPRQLSAAAASLVAAAAVLLLLTAVRTGRSDLHLRLMADIQGLATLPWSGGSGGEPSTQQQQRPPLPPGDPPPEGAEGGEPWEGRDGDDDDDEEGSAEFSFGDPYADPPAARQQQQQRQQQQPQSGGAAGLGGGAAAGAARHVPNTTQCSEALGISRVALLFLTTRRLAHEKLWRLWLWDAAHLLPRQALPALQEGVCGEGASEQGRAAAWGRIKGDCPLAPPTVTSAGISTQLPPQHLFSIYVHAPPDYQGLEYQPLFVGRLIPSRLKTWWGDVSIMEAERALLREALRDARNTKFALISDSDIPLYDPLTLYQQLMHEELSRVRACRKGHTSDDRWRDEMATPHMRKEHWRKSNQFFALTRAHAELVATDTEAYESFKTKCGGWYAHLKRWKECIADEHYIPTLLASHGLEGETYCDGWGLAYTDWSAGGIHPKSFKPREVTPALVKHMRWDCRNMNEAVEDSPGMFLDLRPVLAASSAAEACQQLRDPAGLALGGGSSGGSSGNGGGIDDLSSSGAPGNSSGGSDGVDVLSGGDSSGGGGEHLLERSYSRPLDGACPLTARKFPAFTALRVRQLFVTSCPGGAQATSKAAQLFKVQSDPSVRLLRGQACTAEIQQQAMAHNAAAAAAARAAQAGPGRRLLCAARRWLPGAQQLGCGDDDGGSWWLEDS